MFPYQLKILASYEKNKDANEAKQKNLKCCSTTPQRKNEKTEKMEKNEKTEKRKK